MYIESVWYQIYFIQNFISQICVLIGSFKFYPVHRLFLQRKWSIYFYFRFEKNFHQQNGLFHMLVCYWGIDSADHTRHNSILLSTFSPMDLLYSNDFETCNNHKIAPTHWCHCYCLLHPHILDEKPAQLSRWVLVPICQHLDHHVQVYFFK